MPRPESRANPYVKAKCGHWTTAEYCERKGAKYDWHIKTPEEGGKLKKDGKPDPRLGYYVTNIICAKCTPKPIEKIIQQKEERKVRQQAIRALRKVKCPLCNKPCLADLRLIPSLTYQQYLNDEIDFETAAKILLKAHYRHEHTGYNELRNQIYKLLEKQCFSYEDRRLAGSVAAEIAKGSRIADALEGTPFYFNNNQRFRIYELIAKTKRKEKCSSKK